MLKNFGTRPNWAVSYIAYTKFHLPRPVFHSPGQIFTRIGERASTSFQACLHAFRQLDITWANVDSDLCHHMVLLGHNELIPSWPSNMEDNIL